MPTAPQPTETELEAMFDDLFGTDFSDRIKVQAAISVADKGPLAVRFEAFHRQNPHVYEAIVRIARELRTQQGWRKCGMKMIFERLRWLYAIQTHGDEFKLNNNFTAYYARTVMAANPDLDGFFEVRKHLGEEPYVPDLAALGLKGNVTHGG